MLSAPSQTQTALPLADPRHRPMTGLDGAKHLLDLSADELLLAVWDRSIPWAWDIGLSDDRRELRFLRHSLDAYPRLAQMKPAARAAHAPGWREVLSWILPPGHTKPFLTNPQITRALNCDSDHVLNLIRAKSLKLQPGTTFTVGPAGAALVTRASFEKFLLTRRIEEL